MGMNMTFKTFVLTATAATLAVGLTACNQSTAPATPTPTTPTSAQSVESTPSSQAPSPSATETEPTDESPSPTPSATESSPSATGAVGTMRFDPAPDGRPGAAACYDAEGKGIRVPENQPEITKGAVEAWLCGEAPDGHGSVGPLEPLITNVDALVGDYLALPPLTDGNAQEAASFFHVVLVYPDGTRRVIEGDDQDSTPVIGSGKPKQGSSEFASKVRGHWLDQRFVTKVPVPGEVINLVASCPGPEHNVLASPIDDVNAGWMCHGKTHDTVKKTIIDGALAKRIAESLDINSTPMDGGESVNQNSIHLVTPWGESILLQSLADEDGFQYRGESSMMKYLVPADLARDIDALEPNA